MLQLLRGMLIALSLIFSVVIFVSVYDAPFELADEAIVKGLECQVLNTYRNIHQCSNIPNGRGFRTFSVILIGTFLLPYDVGVFKIVCFTKIIHRVP